MPRLKRFLQDVGKVVPRSILMYSDCGHTSEARTEILRVISEVPFTTLKPTRLIRHIIQMATNPGDLVLDSFAGSGTTGHAVLKMNRENGGQRRFILVELESSIARTITAERLRRVVHGYAWTDSQGAQHQEEGQGGRFCYCTLGPTLFDETGSIRSEVTFQDLAAHVYFTETNQPIPGQATTDSPFIGQAGGTAYYLFFNGVRGGSRLNPDTLRQIADHNGPIIAYADVLDVSAAILQQRSITFKHIPYQLTR